MSDWPSANGPGAVVRALRGGPLSRLIQGDRAQQLTARRVAPLSPHERLEGPQWGGCSPPPHPPTPAQPDRQRRVGAMRIESGGTIGKLQPLLGVAPGGLRSGQVGERLLQGQAGVPGIERGAIPPHPDGLRPVACRRAAPRFWAVADVGAGRRARWFAEIRR